MPLRLPLADLPQRLSLTNPLRNFTSQENRATLISKSFFLNHSIPPPLKPSAPQNNTLRVPQVKSGDAFDETPNRVQHQSQECHHRKQG